MQVFKFGGSSLATASRLATVCDIVGRAAKEDRLVVVVSALGGVTDELVSAIAAAVARELAPGELVDRLACRHREPLHELVGPDGCAQTERVFERELETLRRLLDGVGLLGVCPPSAEHRILSVGERLSAPLVAAVLRARGIPAEPVDGASLITTDARAEVDVERSAKRIGERLGGLAGEVVPVVTGFIAADAEGQTITLGRGGSDHTATLVASALEARQVEIWTDVGGVLSADPRWVPETRPVPCLAFREAAELAFFGAKVIHPKTIAPVESAAIPVAIRNTLEPEGGSTLITGEVGSQPGIRGVAASGDAALFTLNAARGLRTMSRAFEVLARLGVRPLHLAQASSDQSLRLVVEATVAQELDRELRDAFRSEIARNELSLVRGGEPVAVVAAVGGLREANAGVGGEMLRALGYGGVRVLAVANGGSDHSFSVVVRDSEAKRATALVHQVLLGRPREIKAETQYELSGPRPGSPWQEVAGRKGEPSSWNVPV